MFRLSGSNKGIKRKLIRVCIALVTFSAVGITQYIPAEASFVQNEYVSQLKQGKMTNLRGYKTRWGGFVPGVGFVETGDRGGNEVQTYYKYKLVVPNDSVMTISLTGRKNVEIKLSDKDNGLICNLKMQRKKYDGKIAIKKGTYYIQNSSKNNAKFKYRVKKVKNTKENYCANQAKSVKKNKSIQVCQVGKNNYVKWYKIVLNKNQKIRLEGYVVEQTNKASLVTSVLVYDSYGETVEFNETKKGMESTEQVKPGTYYIQVNNFDLNRNRYLFFAGMPFRVTVDDRVGNYIEFKWR